MINARFFNTVFHYYDHYAWLEKKKGFFKSKFNRNYFTEFPAPIIKILSPLHQPSLYEKKQDTPYRPSPTHICGVINHYRTDCINYFELEKCILKTEWPLYKKPSIEMCFIY